MSEEKRSSKYKYDGDKIGVWAVNVLIDILKTLEEIREKLKP